jgi:hypothetical protein
LKSETILYTALLGDYDELKEHQHPRELSFCFTNLKGIKSDSWTLVPCDIRFRSIDERIRTARYFKTQPHRVLPPHRHSIWIDASMQISGAIEVAVSYLNSHGMATFKYPDIYGTRTCAYDEANACIQRGKDASNIIDDQMRRYREEGFPVNFGLAETTIVVRENTKRVARFNDAWWGEIVSGSRRDQLSFDYSCWNEGIKYNWLPGHRLQNRFAKYIQHKERLYSGSPYTTIDIPAKEIETEVR